MIHGGVESSNARMAGASSGEGNTLSELVQRIASDARILARDEVALAKHELSEAAQRSAINLVAVVLGGVLALISLGLLCVTAVVALAPVIPALWARMLIMSGVYLGVGAGLGAMFMARMRRVPLSLPETRAEAKQTLESVAAGVRHG